MSAEMTWEVSIVVDEAAREVVAREVQGDGLLRAYQEATRRVLAGEHRGASIRQGAVLVLRSDSTVEAKRERWESEFYDIDKAGRRRRRYRRTQFERELEDAAKRRKAEARDERRNSKAGDGECLACGDRWYHVARDYGLVHVCGRGLVKREEVNDG